MARGDAAKIMNHPASNSTTHTVTTTSVIAGPVARGGPEPGRIRNGNRQNTPVKRWVSGPAAGPARTVVNNESVTTKNNTRVPARDNTMARTVPTFRRYPGHLDANRRVRSTRPFPQDRALDKTVLSTRPCYRQAMSRPGESNP
jgi:hypothetical protein